MGKETRLNAELLAAIDDVETGWVTRRTVQQRPAATRARLKTGLSQAEFTALFGVSKLTLEQWEQGRRSNGRRECRSRPINHLTVSTRKTAASQRWNPALRWHDWQAVKTACSHLAEVIFDRMCEMEADRSDDFGMEP